MDPLTVTPIGSVHGGRREPIDDDWADVECQIRLDDTRFGPAALAGLDGFSHVDVIFVFHRVDEDEVHLGARRPRDNRDWPQVGIFAQRAKARPNRIGVTTCELVAVDGLVVTVRGLDAIEGSPVLDLKPHMTEFGPRTPVRQPAWSNALMHGYW